MLIFEKVIKFMLSKVDKIILLKSTTFRICVFEIYSIGT